MSIPYFMKTQFYFVFVITAVMTFLTACNPSGNKEVTENKPMHENLIINLTSDATVSAHGSLMGIHLAENALGNGMKATVFLNVNGVKLLQPGADTLVFHGENIIKALNMVAEKGGEIIACPHCMEALGIDKTKIPSNVKVADEKVMMEKLKNNPTVFTY